MAKTAANKATDRIGQNVSEPALKRSISLPLLVFYGLGNILGAGIYVLVGEIAGIAGYYAPFAFLVAATVATFTAFTYGELASRYPLSAGEAVYVQHGFHIKSLSIITGLLIALGGMVSAATITRGFVGYLKLLIELPDPLVIVVVLAVLTSIAIWGISESILIAALFTIFEILGLLLIVWVGRDALTDIHQTLPDLIPPFQVEALSMVMVGGFLAFFAYMGFEDMVNVAEEVKNPSRNLPLAIIIALVISTLLYALVSIVAVSTTSPDALAMSESPLALVYETNTQKQPYFITFIGLFAVINGALIQMIMVSRIFYGMSRNQWLPAFFGHVNAKTRTPINATISVAILIATLALFIPLITLASMTSLVLLIVFVLLNLALLLIKRREPTPAGVKTIPAWIPLLGFLTSTALVMSRFFLDG